MLENLRESSPRASFKVPFQGTSRSVQSPPISSPSSARKALPSLSRTSTRAGMVCLVFSSTIDSLRMPGASCACPDQAAKRKTRPALMAQQNFTDRRVGHLERSILRSRSDRGTSRHRPGRITLADKVVPQAAGTGPFGATPLPGAYARAQAAATKKQLSPTCCRAASRGCTSPSARRGRLALPPGCLLGPFVLPLGSRRCVRRGPVAEQIGADPFAFPVNLLGDRSQLAQDGLGHGQGNLPLTRDDPIRAGAAEGGLLPQVRAPDQDADLRVQLPGEPDDLLGIPQARDAQDQGSGAIHASSLQRLALAGVPIDHRRLLITKALHRLQVQLDHRWL